ncbi:helix-turn-helix domain-containing protein [[Flexibacter] sp. ATCC 35208]|uniref:helix-turn-helix transcriptional regulator n=1 Tax=[Flexibacter] sp. ATCC 35208 TaxID=1936242 RepID=UPI001C6FCD39|nr:helix-turn-helix domain-containing protein [[Flexibacter] sp. ATCC 35208]
MEVNKFVYFYNMQEQLSILKGIHPGIVLERELRKRNLTKKEFAQSINEYPQTLGAITKGKRNMNIWLALKIEHALNIEEGYFMVLQVYYDIQEEKRKRSVNQLPDLSKLRRVLFWDTQMEKIDWQKQKRAVILRVFERGNEQEKEEIIRFYGKKVVDEIIKDYNTPKYAS